VVGAGVVGVGVAGVGGVVAGAATPTTAGAGTATPIGAGTVRVSAFGSVSNRTARQKPEPVAKQPHSFGRLALMAGVVSVALAVVEDAAAVLVASVCWLSTCARPRMGANASVVARPL
jgi:hypothetical protein